MASAYLVGCHGFFKFRGPHRKRAAVGLQEYWLFKTSMDITRFIVSQREKALLVGDYGFYRKQLSRRLLVLRNKLNYISSKGKKYAAKTPITAEDIGRNHESVSSMLRNFGY